MNKKLLDDSTYVRLYFFGCGSFVSINVTWILNTYVINSIHTLILEDKNGQNIPRNLITVELLILEVPPHWK
jgi:hypothetical protein